MLKRFRNIKFIIAQKRVKCYELFCQKESRWIVKKQQQSACGKITQTLFYFLLAILEGFPVILPAPRTFV